MQNENIEKHATLAAAPTAKPVPPEPDDFTPRYLDTAELTFTRSEVGDGTTRNSKRSLLSARGGATAYATQQSG